MILTLLCSFCALLPAIEEEMTTEIDLHIDRMEVSLLEVEERVSSRDLRNEIRGVLFNLKVMRNINESRHVFMKQHFDSVEEPHA